MLFPFTYAGVVEANKDPLKLGRLKVRVPHVFGSNSTGSGYIPVNDLPWALPAGMPAGGSADSGGFSQIPEIGDKVWVRFLDGEPEKPIWEWGMQTFSDRDNLKLHEYASGTPVGPPDRAILSRYGNSLEITDPAVTLTTRQGYQVRLENSTGPAGGSAALVTPAGQRVSLNDLGKSIVIQGLDSVVVSADSAILNGATDAMIRASQTLVLMVGGTLLTITDESVILNTTTGATLVVDADGNISVMSSGGAAVSVENARVQINSPTGTAIVVEEGKVSVSASQMVFNTSALAVGTDARYPALMLTPEALAWFLGHTHTNGNNGSPTGPPILQFPDDAASTRMQLT